MEKEIEILCPKCQHPMILNRGGAFCDKDSCQMKVWRRVAGKELTDRQLKQLVEEGKVYVKGLRSRKGSEFECWLVLQEHGDVKFEFEKDPPRKKPKDSDSGSDFASEAEDVIG